MPDATLNVAPSFVPPPPLPEEASSESRATRSREARPEPARQEPEYFRSLVEQVRLFWAPMPDKPEETPEGIARALWLTAAGVPASVVRASRMRLPVLSEASYRRCLALVQAKRDGTPLAHLTGRQNFLGLEMLAGPEALVPRVETEIVCRAALSRLDKLAAERGSLRILDLCTGSGNLALSFAYHQPNARVHAADLSPEAVALARRNARHLALEVDFRIGDLFAPFDTPAFIGRFDLVCCNPPYIPAAKVPQMHSEISAHEPELAFNGGIYGISILTRLLKDAPRFLKPRSWIAFELGAGQGPALVRRLQSNAAFDVVEAQCDATGEIRAILARTV